MVNLLRMKPGSRKSPLYTENPEQSFAMVAEQLHTGWLNASDRIAHIRKGMPVSALEGLARRMQVPVKAVLLLVRMPQTTYNKRKAEAALLDTATTEWLMNLNDLLDLGMEVFNREEAKFIHWLQKPNISLGGPSPFTLLDTFTGIREVQRALVRLEYGNLA